MAWNMAASVLTPTHRPTHTTSHPATHPLVPLLQIEAPCGFAMGLPTVTVTWKGELLAGKVFPTGQMFYVAEIGDALLCNGK